MKHRFKKEFKRPEILKLRDCFNNFDSTTKGKIIRGTINNFDNYKEVPKALLSEINRLWLESDGGIHVMDLGYFCVSMNPDKTYAPNRYFDYFSRLNTGGYAYTPIHINDLSVRNRLYGFKIHNNSVQHVSKMYKQLAKGRRYTMHNELIKTITRKQKHLIN